MNLEPENTLLYRNGLHSPAGQADGERAENSQSGTKASGLKFDRMVPLNSAKDYSTNVAVKDSGDVSDFSRTQDLVRSIKLASIGAKQFKRH